MSADGASVVPLVLLGEPEGERGSSRTRGSGQSPDVGSQPGQDESHRHLSGGRSSALRQPRDPDGCTDGSLIAGSGGVGFTRSPHVPASTQVPVPRRPGDGSGDGSGPGCCNTPGKSFGGTPLDGPVRCFLGDSADSKVELSFTRGTPLDGVVRRPVRAAVDWWVTHFRLRVAGDTYGQLVAAAGGDVAVVVDGSALHLKVTHQRTRVVLQGDGLHLVVADPAVQRADQTGGQHGEHYGATLQFQGRLLSTGDTGLDVVRAVRPAVWALLYPGLTFAEVERHTRVGRMDFAVDVEHKGDGAELAVDAFYEGESATAVYANFATHTSAGSTSQTLQILGGKTNGRTFYTGKSPLYRVYEREKHTGDGHWEVLLETLKRRGYDGTSPLLRCEVQVDRSRWQRDQTCGCDRCGGRPITEWTEDEAMAHVEGIAKGLFDRCRHTEGGEDEPAKLRPTSPLWTAVLDGTSQFATDGCPQVVVQLRCVQRRLLRERRITTAANAISDLCAVGLNDEQEYAKPSEVLASVIDRLIVGRSMDEAIHRELQRANRARYRVGLQPSEALHEQIRSGWSDDERLHKALLVLRGESDVDAAVLDLDGATSTDRAERLAVTFRQVFACDAVGLVEVDRAYQRAVRRLAA